MDAPDATRAIPAWKKRLLQVKATSRPDLILARSGLGGDLSWDSLLGVDYTLVEFKFCSDTKPDEAARKAINQHRDLTKELKRSGSCVTANTQVVLVGISGVVYNTYTIGSLQSLGLDRKHATAVAEKLHKLAVSWIPQVVSARRTAEHARSIHAHTHTHTRTAAGPPAADPG
jgi:hypothetical protein